MSESHPAPLNPQARADIDQALASTGVKGDLNPKATEDIDRAVHTAGIDKLNPDPLKQIEEELVSNWEKDHGNKWDGNTLRAEFQDFMFGDPTAPTRGEVPITLEERAKREYLRRFPDKVQEMQEGERAKAYDDPYADPAIRDAEKLITTRTNLDSEVVKAAQEGKSQAWNEAWYRVNNRLSFQGWNQFVDQYPEKAQAYKDKFPQIKAIFEGRERARKAREKQIAVGVARTQSGVAVIENSISNGGGSLDQLRLANPDYDYEGITADMITRATEWASSKGIDPISLSPAQIVLAQAGNEIKNLNEVAAENKNRRLEVLRQNKDLLRQVLTSEGQLYAHATPSVETAQTISDTGLYCDSNLGLNGVAERLTSLVQSTDQQREEALGLDIERLANSHQGYRFVVLVDLPKPTNQELEDWQKKKAQGENVYLTAKYAEKMGQTLRINAVDYDAKIPDRYIKGFIDLDTGQFIPKVQK